MRRAAETMAGGAQRMEGNTRNEENRENKNVEGKKMNRVQLLVRTLGITCVAIGAASEAGAALTGLPDNVTYTVGMAGNSVIVGANGIKIDSSFEGNFYLGEITLTKVGGATTPYRSTWSTVCTDVKGTIYIGTSYHFSDAQFTSSVQGLNPAWGSDRDGGDARSAIQNAADIFNDRSGATVYALGGHTYTRPEWWAAMQLAVWESLYDSGSASGFNYSGGRFQVSAGAVSANILTLANAFLRPADATYSGNILIPLTNLRVDGVGRPIGDANPENQELLYLTTATPVPEPATVLAGALLLIPFGVSTLRVIRRRRTE